jgi:thiosulfate reductase cytochrome b subunit
MNPSSMVVKLITQVRIMHQDRADARNPHAAIMTISVLFVLLHVFAVVLARVPSISGYLRRRTGSI